MINLTPDKYKSELKGQIRERAILEVEYFSIILIILCFVATFCINIFLQAELDFQKASLLGYKQGEEIAKLDERIKNINEKAQMIAKFREAKTSQVEILNKVASNLVKGVKIQVISAKKQKDVPINSIKISGLAEDNSSLMDLRTKLESDKEISKLVIPDILFLKENDINFDISFDYKKQ